MTKIQRDKQRGGAFEQTSIVERPRVNDADPWNHSGKLRHRRFRFPAIATDQGVAIERMIQVPKRFGAQSMKRRNHWHTGNQTSCLLRGRAIPQREYARDTAADRDFERNSGVY